jgi:hypothetical protein
MILHIRQGEIYIIALVKSVSIGYAHGKLNCMKIEVVLGGS